MIKESEMKIETNINIRLIPSLLTAYKSLTDRNHMYVVYSAEDFKVFMEEVCYNNPSIMGLPKNTEWPVIVTVVNARYLDHVDGKMTDGVPPKSIDPKLDDATLIDKIRKLVGVSKMPMEVCVPHMLPLDAEGHCGKCTGKPYQTEPVVIDVKHLRTGIKAQRSIVDRARKLRW